MLLLLCGLFTLVVGEPQRGGLFWGSSAIQLFDSLLLVYRGLVEYDLIQAVAQAPILLLELRYDELQGLHLRLSMTRPFPLIHLVLIEVPDVLLLQQHLPEALLCLRPEFIYRPLVVLKLLRLKLLQRLELDPELLAFTISDLPPLHLLVEGQLECLSILADDPLSLQR
jgi:hypothetical protein